jgi:putative ABC transport system permease protein
LGNAWKEILPGVPFRYEFLDDRYQRQYKNESNVATMAAGFTFLSILIACFGLIGLVTYYTEKKFKEIGIRKVIGASVTQILILITSNFLKVQVLSVIFAVPISYFLVTKWLEGFAYKISFPFIPFLLTILLIFIVSLLAVIYQSIKAARTNPVKVLKDE